MTTAVEVLRQWDASALQTEAFAPAMGHSVLLGWQSDPPSIDAAVPQGVAGVIAEVFSILGDVAFRWSGPPTWSPTEARLIPAPTRDPLQRARDWLTTSWPTDIVVTRSSRVAMELFEHEWDTQGQMALLLDSQGENIEAALAELRTRREWRTFEVAPPVLALLAPIVDGDGAQLTTQSADQTEFILGRLAHAFSGTAIEFKSC